MQSEPMTHRARAGKARSKRTAEFAAYFALLFVVAIPWATVEWIGQAIQRRTLNLRGPLARAWAEADRITPLIFSQ